MLRAEGVREQAPFVWTGDVSRTRPDDIRVGRTFAVGYREVVPLYEYRCTACRKRVTILTLRVGEESHPKCEHCGGTKLERLLSRFAMPRSEESRLSALSDPSQLSGLDENDPKSMARWMKRVGGELGDELGGGELDEMVDGIQSGAGADDDDPSGGGSCGDGGGCDVD